MHMLGYTKWEYTGPWQYCPVRCLYLHALTMRQWGQARIQNWEEAYGDSNVNAYGEFKLQNMAIWSKSILGSRLIMTGAWYLLYGTVALLL